MFKKIPILLILALFLGASAYADPWGADGVSKEECEAGGGEDWFGCSCYAKNPDGSFNYDECWAWNRQTKKCCDPRKPGCFYVGIAAAVNSRADATAEEAAFFDSEHDTYSGSQGSWQACEKQFFKEWTLWDGGTFTDKEINEINTNVNQALGLSDKRSVWKTVDGKFNGARLGADLGVGVVLGTAGGVITSVVMKKKQLENGMGDIQCHINGQFAGEYGDEILIEKVIIQKQ